MVKFQSLRYVRLYTNINKSIELTIIRPGLELLNRPFSNSCFQLMHLVIYTLSI